MAGGLLDGSAVVTGVLAESNSFLGAFAPLVAVVLGVVIAGAFIGVVSRFWR